MRDEFSTQRIHSNLSISKLSTDSGVSYGTVKRFYEFGKGHGKLTYSYFHGPAVTTVFGIADALGLQVSFKKKNGRGGNGRS